MGVFSEIDLQQKESGGLCPFEEAPNRPLSEVWAETGAHTQIPLASVQNGDAPEEKPVPQTEDAPSETTVQNEADEEAARKAHEMAEAKRKAEWEEKQAAKKAAEQEQLQRLASMSDDEVMAASTQRVGADTEKITRRNMKDCVTEVIQTKCLDDPAFARLVMHPKKNMLHCFKYITRKAWEYVQDELKVDGITPGQREQGYGCDVPDYLCYQWAVDYFNDADAEEDKEKAEEFVPQPYIPKYKGGSKKKAQKEKKAAAPAKPPKPPKPAPSEEGQLSLDFEHLGKAG